MTTPIQRVLKRAYVRIACQRFIASLVVTLTVAGGALLVLRVLERGGVLGMDWQAASLWAGGSAVAFSLVWVLARMPGRTGVARIVDESAHLKESLSTALAIESQTDDWSRAAVEAFYRALPDAVWRSKGFVTVDGAPSLVQYTMGQLEVTPAAKHLLGGIHETYEKKTGKAYGTFQSNVETFPFSGYLDRFLGGTGGDFTSFTQRSMRRFKLEIDKADWATGGYVVFILYDNSRPEGQEAPDVGQKAEEEPGPHLIVVMLNDRRGTAVNPDTLEIRDITHLVLEELHLAVRIDIGSWQADEARYLSFVKGRRSGATVSRYFRDFVGCDEFVDPVSQSRLLVRASRQFVEHEKLSKEAALEIRRTIYEAAVEAHENAQELDLVEISKRLDPFHRTQGRLPSRERDRGMIGGRSEP